MEAFGNAAIATLILILEIMKWVIIFSAVLSWLVAFDIVNTRSRFVYMLWDGTRRLTAPLLDPVRRILPDFGGIDISPIVVLVAIFFLQSLLRGIQF